MSYILPFTLNAFCVYTHCWSCIDCNTNKMSEANHNKYLRRKQIVNKEKENYVSGSSLGRKKLIFGWCQMLLQATNLIF